MAPTSARNRVVPTYTIDLATPPQLRYAKLAEDFGERMRSIQHLFDELLALLFPAAIVRKSVKLLARTALHRLRSDDETQEIRGLAQATGIDLYLFVVFNTVLDYLLGCTSGAVRVKPSKATAGTAGGSAKKGAKPGSPENPFRLLHFRTLDWGMDRLRDLLVVLEFVDSSSAESPDRVLARSITYAGFIGTLTAVRENMSVSMNFRPNHTCHTHSLWLHQFLVLVGRRHSLPSILRSFILDGVYPQQRGASSSSVVGTAATASPGPRPPPKPQNLKDEARRLAATTSAPCYLVLCDGTEVVAIEKDLTEGSIRSSTDFLVHTNHDVHEAEASSDPDVVPGVTMHASSVSLLSFEEWLEDSTNRRDSVAKKWRRHVEKYYPTPTPAAPAPPRLSTESVSSTTRRQSRRQQQQKQNGNGNANGNHSSGNDRISSNEDGDDGDKEKPNITLATLKRWIQADPVTNNCTHFSCIMDPKMGEIRWMESLDPPEEDEEEEEQTV